MSAELAIIIVSYNTRDDLDRCLASLQANPPTAPTEIIVVDNGSRDGSAELVAAKWPAVTLIALGANVGFAAANNAAILRAGSPLVLLLNSDTLVPAGAIDTLVARLRATGAVAAGPRLVDGRGRPEVSFGRMLSPWTELQQARLVRAAAASTPSARRRIARHVSRERFVDWVTGACLLVRREAALAAGLLDERYFMYEEDVDFCAALRARGGRILFTPHAEVTHLRGRSVGQAGGSASKHYDRSHVVFYEKHAPRWAPLLRLWLRLRRRAFR
jgi:hypothetical protein